jgi:hypothetical protein
VELHHVKADFGPQSMNGISGFVDHQSNRCHPGRQALP